MDLISVIVPCYNEEEVLPLFYDEITRVLNSIADIDYEILLVNDGSRDKTLQIMKDYAQKDSRIKYISFSRNFGKEAAMYAGLQNAKGDYVVILDADLQHPPSLIPKMYEIITTTDYDCVGSRRTDRAHEPRIRSYFARKFYKIVNRISQTEIVDGAHDFRFMSRQMVDAILTMTEYNRFSKGIFSWVGFKTKYLEMKNAERAAGTTSWSFWKLFIYAIDGIVAFSTAPLWLSIILGAVFMIVGILGTIFAIVDKIISLYNWIPYLSKHAFGTLLISTMLFLSGLVMCFMGITSIYLSKIYMEVKNRPVYIVKESNVEKTDTEV
ncbi:MAG: glycosyltransferase family 2 protein [Oscillospiraceae bacterium]|jgi:glycosyltransferase involved in cell wall biosynthesis|nr:glycosyltransferase family 2 protein [Oscillospiraceae bacterium]